MKAHSQTVKTQDAKMLLADRVASTIRERIHRGEYPAETLLPPERDLASELDVSRTTISSALAQLAKSGLIERARGRGTKVLPEAARPTRPTIAIISARIEDSPTLESPIITQGIVDRLKELGYSTDPIHFYARSADKHTRGSCRRFVSYYELPNVCEPYAAAIGIECTGASRREMALDWGRRKRPFVVANLESDFDACATCVDHVAVFRKAVGLLADFGHKRIALLIRDPEVAFYAKALEGYRQGMAAARLPQEERFIVEMGARGSALTAYVAARNLLAQPERPTAIIAGRDIFAEGVVQAIQEANLRLGHHVSVIGYDNTSWRVDEPFLTTFHEPCYELGVEAANLLDDRIRNGWRPPEKRVLDAPLILRRSAGPVCETDDKL